MDILLQDVRYALRSLRRQPAFAGLAMLTLALGIGANAAIFSVVNAVLLRPLDYRTPDRIVAVTTLWEKTGLHGTVSAPDFHDWHDTATSFDAMAYYTYSADAGESVSVDGVADYASEAIVTPGFFQIFGVQPQIGHLLGPDEERPGGPLAAVIGHDFWVRRFGGRPDVLGRTVTFGERAYTIIGVLPSRFQFPDKTDIWSPAWVHAETVSRSAHNYRVVARLKDGVSVERAQAEMTGIAARLSAAYPLSNQNKSAAVTPLREELVGSTRATLYLLLGAVALVLLIACANVANLLLARATSRTTELAVRAALGAARRRIVTQLLTESVVLSLVSGIAGVALSKLGVAALIALAPAGLPRVDEIAVDGRVLAFALGLSMAASLVFGVLPAAQASRLDLNASLHQGGRGGAIGGGGARFRSALVVAEIAIAVALVVGASLLIRSFVALGHVDLGFQTERLLVAESTVPARDLAGARRATEFYAGVMPRLAALPGVASVAGVRGLPAAAMHSNGGYWLEGGPGPDVQGIRSPQAVFTVVTPNYFHTMGVPVRGGRDFSDRDQYDAPFVTIVNDAFVRQSFPNGDAIGHRIQCGLDSLTFMTIVGVVGNVRQGDPSRPPRAEIYMPFLQHPFYGSSLTLVARTSVEPMAIANGIREVIRGANANVPVRIGTMEDTMSDAVSTPRFRTTLVGVFAALAFLLAIAGVYGVMAYTVGRRTAEIGLRMALGAGSPDIVRMVMTTGLRMAAAGIALGCALAYAVAQLLRGMLFAVGPADPIVFAGVPIVLLLTAAAACALPAIRASRVDPMIALRAD
ncbi:MAG TPA: ABC transporter permease [Vicinamibacterales bacterium]|jgi:predicted permease|nr:ABC transporter permease [Vicinamibacterales bacterium]